MFGTTRQQNLNSTCLKQDQTSYSYKLILGEYEDVVLVAMHWKFFNQRIF